MYEVNDMMSFVFKLFLSNEAVITVLIGYILLASMLNLIKYVDKILKGSD